MGCHPELVENGWYWSIEHNQLCLIVDVHSVWNEISCRIWLPEHDAVVRVNADRLKPVNELPNVKSEKISYIVSAARVADTLTHDVLLAPIESKVIPLPHQLNILSRATSNDRVRFMLADEVGLGKTIEAGLIMRELKLRGLVRRILVVAPKGLVTQWVAEMKTHFEEDFRLLIPSDFSAYRQISGKENIWHSHNQVICPMDSVKPLDKRRGWSKKRIAEYNRDRFDDLICAGWDLVVVDEAHRLGGSTDQVARFKLGQGLSEAAPYFLLLSATPHQGKTEAFHRLLTLVDADAFPDITSVTRDRVHPYVLRTEKRQAIDAEGKALFMPRQTQMKPVSWELKHQKQKILYESVTEYVRKGYNQSQREKRNYIGFLMILMQRLVTSSTNSITATLERRLSALETYSKQLELSFEQIEEDWDDLDGQEQLEILLENSIEAFKNERTEVEILLNAAKQCEETGPDVKAEALLDLIYKLQQEESDPDLKILIFTEFVPTQEMLKQFLGDRGFSAVCLNGSMDMTEREQAQNDFAQSARILISTDAGGEGLNLQFCHVVVNYDIPWNPMRLEQRIGRVDRIGQKHVVRAINFVFEDTVEHRVREVLEEKLSVIQEEFGIDKMGDVLDSAQAGQIFDNLYVEAILNPANADAEIDTVVNRIQEQAHVSKNSLSILGATENVNPDAAKQLLSHPLPHWVERMTTCYLKAHGGKVEKVDSKWNITWPDGETLSNVVFSTKDAEGDPTIIHLTLEDSKIRGLASRLSHFVPEQPIPEIVLADLPENVSGFWSLWRISVITEDWNRQRIMPLFLHDDNRCLIPTAQRIWDQLLSISPEITGYRTGPEAQERFTESFQIAESNGRSIYEELHLKLKKRLLQEREKGEYAFEARKRAVERIGLPEVRNFRLNRLDQEQRSWRESLERKNRITPELVPLLILRIKGVIS